MVVKNTAKSNKELADACSKTADNTVNCNIEVSKLAATDATGVSFEAGDILCFEVKAYNANNKCTYDASQPTWGSEWSDDFSKLEGVKTVTNCVQWLKCADQIDKTKIKLDDTRTNWFDMTVQWSSPANDGGSSITSYLVQYKEESQPDEKFSSWMTTKSTRIGIPGLITKKKYVFRIKACNAINCEDCPF